MDNKKVIIITILKAHQDTCKNILNFLALKHIKSTPTPTLMHPIPIIKIKNILVI